MHKVILRKYSIFGETLSEKEIRVEETADIYLYNGEYYTHDCQVRSDNVTIYRNMDAPVVIEGE